MLTPRELLAALRAGRWSIENDFLYCGNKQGGANGAGALGGKYRRKASRDEEPEVLIKQDTSSWFLFWQRHNVEKDIAEVVGGMLLKKMIDEDAASVGFIKSAFRKHKKSDDTTTLLHDLDDDESEVEIEPDETGENIYVVSVLLKNCVDLYAHAYKRAGKAVPSDRPRVIGLAPVMQSVLKEECKGFARATVGAMVIGDVAESHSANLMVDEETGYLKRIDFGGSLNGLTDQVEPHALMGHLPGFGPPNHYRKYPRAVRVSKEIADEMERVALIDLDSTVDEAIGQANKFYGIKPLAAFAERLGVPKQTINAATNKNKELLVQETGNFLKQRLKRRQASLKKVALEIRIDIAIKKRQNGQFYVGNDLVELVLQNLDYFQKRSYDYNFHFRAEEHRGSNWFDRLIGWTSIKLAILLNRKVQVIFQHQETLQEIHDTFSGIKNSIIRNVLTEKLYGKVFDRAPIGNWPNLTGLIDKINRLFPQDMPADPERNRKWISDVCRYAPEGLKLLLQEMGTRNIATEPGKTVTLLDIAATQHALEAPSYTHQGLVGDSDFKTLAQYNRKTANSVFKPRAPVFTKVPTAPAANIKEKPIVPTGTGRAFTRY